MRASISPLAGGLLFLTASAAIASAYVVRPLVESGIVDIPGNSTGSAPPPVLYPIHPDTYHSAVGLRVRDVTDFSRLDPTQQAQLIYGSPGDAGTILLANMTLYAPDDTTPILLLESFDGLTKAVDCNDDDGVLSVSFNDRDAYTYAMGKWSYINEDAEQTFLLIANNAGCGPDEQRAVYT